jgi:hypothetical protein
MRKRSVVRIYVTQFGDGLKGRWEWSTLSALLPGGKRLWEWIRLPTSLPGGEGLWEWRRLSAPLPGGKRLREWRRLSAPLPGGEGLWEWRKLGHLLSARRDSSDAREMVWAMLRAMLFRRDKDGDGS